MLTTKAKKKVQSRVHVMEDVNEQSSNLLAITVLDDHKKSSNLLAITALDDH